MANQIISDPANQLAGQKQYSFKLKSGRAVKHKIVEITLKSLLIDHGIGLLNYSLLKRFLSRVHIRPRL